jgi:hypothetical protein
VTSASLYLRSALALASVICLLACQKRPTRRIAQGPRLRPMAPAPAPAPDPDPDPTSAQPHTPNTQTEGNDGVEPESPGEPPARPEAPSALQGPLEAPVPAQSQVPGPIPPAGHEPPSSSSSAAHATQEPPPLPDPAPTAGEPPPPPYPEPLPGGKASHEWPGHGAGAPGGLAFAAPASPVPEVRVYVTRNGRFYHTAHCRTIRMGRHQALDLAEAIQHGYQRCPHCHRD